MKILDYERAKPGIDQLIMDELNAKCREILGILPDNHYDSIDVLVKVLSYQIYLKLTDDKKRELETDQVVQSLNNISKGMAEYICCCNFAAMTSKARG